MIESPTPKTDFFNKLINIAKEAKPTNLKTVWFDYKVGSLLGLAVMPHVQMRKPFRTLKRFDWLMVVRTGTFIFKETIFIKADQKYISISAPQIRLKTKKLKLYKGYYFPIEQYKKDKKRIDFQLKIEKQFVKQREEQLNRKVKLLLKLLKNLTKENGC